MSREKCNALQINVSTNSNGKYRTTMSTRRNESIESTGTAPFSFEPLPWSKPS